MQRPRSATSTVSLTIFLSSPHFPVLPLSASLSKFTLTRTWHRWMEERNPQRICASFRSAQLNSPVSTHGLSYLRASRARQALQLPGLVESHSNPRLDSLPVLRHPRHLVRATALVYIPSPNRSSFYPDWFHFDKEFGEWFWFWTLHVVISAIEPSVTANWSYTSTWLRTATRRFSSTLRFFKLTSSKVILRSILRLHSDFAHFRWLQLIIVS